MSRTRSLSPLEASSDTCPIQLPSAAVAGTDSAAQVLVSGGTGPHRSQSSSLTVPLLDGGDGGGRGGGIRGGGERFDTFVHIIYRDLSQRREKLSLNFDSRMDANKKWVLIVTHTLSGITIKDQFIKIK